jgi:hypothetical protein
MFFATVSAVVPRESIGSHLSSVLRTMVDSLNEENPRFNDGIDY